MAFPFCPPVMLTPRKEETWPVRRKGIEPKGKTEPSHLNVPCFFQHSSNQYSSNINTKPPHTKSLMFSSTDAGNILG